MSTKAYLWVGLVAMVVVVAGVVLFDEMSLGSTLFADPAEQTAAAAQPVAAITSGAPAAHLFGPIVGVLSLLALALFVWILFVLLRGRKSHQ